MLRAFRSLRVLRRFLTAFVALSIAGNALEIVVPDIHDGDAELGSVARFVRSTAAGIVSGHASPVGDAVSAQTPGDIDVTGHRLPAGDDSRGPEHVAHVEHCGQAHAATPAVWAAMSAPPNALGDAPTACIAALVSAVLLPALRPPIA